jgi:hypothetical protein
MNIQMNELHGIGIGIRDTPNQHVFFISLSFNLPILVEKKWNEIMQI